MAKVLVAEDSPPLRSILEQILKNAGYDVICAKNGIEAYTLFMDIHPDIVITDNKMPGMMGIELILLLREEGFKVPMILLSGDRVYFKGYLEELTFLEKPINYRKLLSLLDAYNNSFRHSSMGSG